MGRRADGDLGAAVGSAAHRALWERDSRGACHAHHRSQEGYQGSQVIGTEIEQGSAARLVKEGRVGVPGLRSVVEEKGSGAHRFSDSSFVDQLAAGLQTGAQEVSGAQPTRSPLSCAARSKRCASSRLTAKGFSL